MSMTKEDLENLRCLFIDRPQLSEVFYHARKGLEAEQRSTCSVIVDEAMTEGRRKVHEAEAKVLEQRIERLKDGIVIASRIMPNSCATQDAQQKAEFDRILEEVKTDNYSNLLSENKTIGTLKEKIAVLTQENAELATWKATEQQALISMAATLLNAGFKGESVVDGIKWLSSERDTALAQVEELRKDKDVLEHWLYRITLKLQKADFNY